ncbi:unnamed protein product [Cuscuta campestris]|uniref:Phytocyanin domain-containing protein n=1 Tax=Cuscuta campestris TaxID=132261 RepID=A0A484N333_9ASTE|nr:unnamed protein product [Cuscuta campestris]
MVLLCNWFPFAAAIVVAGGMLLISADAYKNYTVGDSSGWNDANSSVDYRKWTSGKTFSLGDFLIFNITDTNHSVIQTYNETTYERCDDEDDESSIQWSSTDPSSTSPHPASVAVPLTKVGVTYFLSADYDGEQCKNGQRLMVNVTYGQGLPPSLKSPDKSPAPASPQSGDDNAVPETLVPANFDHPRDVGDEDTDRQSSSGCLGSFAGVFGSNGIFLLVLSLSCII